MRTSIAVILCLALAMPGCATTGATRPGATSSWVPDRAAMADYVQRIPAGTRVRVELVNGQRVRGTLMRADESSVLVNPATRIPEPPVEVAVADLRAVEPERSSGIGKVVAIGAAAGAAATFGVLLLLYALAGGD